MIIKNPLTIVQTGGGDNKLKQIVDGSLTTVTAGDLEGVTSIRNYAFGYCSSLTTITIPEEVTSIGFYAFNLCTNLQSVNFGTNSSLQTIGNGVFSGCSSLQSVDFNNCQITEIPYSAFSNCTSLTTITIPEKVTSIGNYAFSGCSNLQTVDFGTNSSLQTIGSDAFSSCTSLTTITIPEGVNSISSNVFRQCSNLTSMRVEATTPPTLRNTGAISTATTQIQVPMASVEVYKTATNWTQFADIIVGYTE